MKCVANLISGFLLVFLPYVSLMFLFKTFKNKIQSEANSKKISPLHKNKGYKKKRSK